VVTGTEKLSFGSGQTPIKRITIIPVKKEKQQSGNPFHEKPVSYHADPNAWLSCPLQLLLEF
jgi:hypothetical protein